MKQLILARLKMFGHQRILLFWLVLFPMLMGILMKLAFGKLMNQNQSPNVQPIAVAVVGRNEQQQFLYQTLIQTKQANQQKLFHVQHTSASKAKNLLRHQRIAGYFQQNQHQKWTLYLIEKGFAQQILRNFLTAYLQNNHQQQMPQNSRRISLRHWTSRLDQKRHFNSFSFYFFVLLAFTILDGYMLGLTLGRDEQPQQSALGVRLRVGPTSYLKIWLSDLLATWLVFYLLVLLILAFFHWGLDIPFGTRWGWLLLVIALGCLLSISGGQLWNKLLVSKSYAQQSNLGLVIVLCAAMLSGLMGTIDLKFWIGQHLPLLGNINLNTLLGDCFYQLFFYQDLQPFYTNLAWLIGILCIIFLINLILERKNAYEHL
ncbi:ABC transporter permease [Bombilactobacillus folatiphilus]|uniref:ABC transporter permease n=1 Tax=Bombilactobacillus folatiphilus TaxID=2923362 RepID=A0ABY4PAL0_9LACO|nr:ABC transporter permease [Bombilactobacillus folatiphilus]UQS82660.1 ABC transporter permease [Bombilactobacillus folatiphilus]